MEFGFGFSGTEETDEVSCEPVGFDSLRDTATVVLLEVTLDIEVVDTEGEG